MRRLKRTLKWTGIVLGGLVAIGLIANAVFVWTTDTRLERQLAAIRAEDAPLTLADLARPPIPPEKNAATYIRRAEAGIAAIEKEIGDLRPVSECPGFLMPPEDQKTVRAALAAYPDVIPLLERAAACPDYDPELDYTLPPTEFLAKSLDVVTRPRSAVWVLRCRAELLVAEGNRDEAVRTALVIFRLARHFDRYPMLVGYLVAVAVRGCAIEAVNAALQTGSVSKEVRDALDAELALQERMDGFVWALKSERSYTLSFFSDAVPARNFWLIARGMWNIQESACLESCSTFLGLACDPRPYRAVEQTIEAKESVLAALLSPAMKATHAAVTRTRAEIRVLRVLNALQTRVPAGSNDVPRLTELGLPAETITDPYTGEPLRVKKTPEGWLAYSVGPDFQDDGGKLDDPLHGDVGVGPPSPVARPAKNDQEETREKRGSTRYSFDRLAT